MDYTLAREEEDCLVESENALLLFRSLHRACELILPASCYVFTPTEPNAGAAHHVLDELLHHHDSVGTSADIRVHRDHEDAIRHTVVHVVELLAPDLKDL
jgi:hypothetical protein